MGRIHIVLWLYYHLEIEKLGTLIRERHAKHVASDLEMRDVDIIFGKLPILPLGVKCHRWPRR